MVKETSLADIFKIISGDIDKYYLHFRYKK